AGASFDAIARTLGYRARSGAHKAVLAALHETLVEPADAVRQLELDRLDRLLLAVWQPACGGDYRAIEIVLKLMDRRAAYLGLDAPQRIDIEARIRTMAAELGLDPDEAIAEAGRIVRSGRD